MHPVFGVVLHLSYSFRLPLLVDFPKGNKVIYIPEPIRDASGHGRGHAKCTMNLDEVIGEIVEGSRRRVIL
jgi:hypothetical protein